MVHINLEKSNWPYALGTPKGAYGNKTALAVTLGHVRYIPRKPKEQMFSFVPGPTRPISQPIRHTHTHAPITLQLTHPSTQWPCIYSGTPGLLLQYTPLRCRTHVQYATGEYDSWWSVLQLESAAFKEKRSLLKISDMSDTPQQKVCLLCSRRECRSTACARRRS